MPDRPPRPPCPPRPPVVAVTATIRTEADTRRIRLNAAYTTAVERAGALPIVIPPLSSIAEAARLLTGADALLLTGGVRFLVRCAREGRLSWRRDTGKRTLVVGAGAAADRLLRELDRDRDRALSVIALVDDDPALRHMTLHGVPVAGTVEDIESLVTQHQIELVIIAISTATPAELRRIVDRCLRAKVAFKRLTPLRDMLDVPPVGRFQPLPQRDLRLPAHRQQPA